MASNVVFIDSTFRRAQVKATPNSYMSDLLQQACSKLGLSADQYTIKSNNKPVDLSRTFKQTGLPSGAQLHLVQASRSPTVISIALQLPASENNARLTDKFPSTFSIWQILRGFESGVAGGSSGRLNFTQRAVPQTQSGEKGAGRLFYEMPVVQVMGRELSSFVDLQKTLGQLGITSGNALLRLNYKSSGMPLEQAMSDISEYFKSSEPQTVTGTQETQQPGASNTEHDAASTAATATATATTKDVVKSEEEPSTLEQADSTVKDAMEVDEAPAPAPAPAAAPAAAAAAAAADTPQTAQHPEESKAAAAQQQSPTTPTPTATPAAPAADPNAVLVYSAPTSSTPLAAQQAFNASDYVPTVEHAKIHQERLQTHARNKRLPSDAELAATEQERRTKLAQVSAVRVRVRLPDQTALETSFAARGSSSSSPPQSSSTSSTVPATSTAPANATAKDVYAFVRERLAAPPDTGFRLRYVDTRTGAHAVLPVDGTADLIADLGWKGSVLVHMVWDESVGADVRGKPCLRDDLLKAAKQMEVQLAGKGAGAGGADDGEDGEKKGRFLGGIFGSGGGKEKMSNADKETKLKNLLRFGKK